MGKMGYVSTTAALCLTCVAWRIKSEAAAGCVFDDAAAWYCGAVDANSDGRFQSGELRDALHGGVAGHANHNLSNLGLDEDLAIATQEVGCPLRGVSHQQDCLTFQPKRNDSDPNMANWTYRCTAVQLPELFVVSNQAAYSVVMRFRATDIMHQKVGAFANLVSIGHRNNATDGYGVLLRASIATGFGPTNLFIAPRIGGSDWINSMTNKTWTSSPAYRFTTNQWVDAALVCANGKLKVYCFPEGGRLFTNETAISSKFLRTGDAKWSLGGAAGFDKYYKTSQYGSAAQGLCGEIASFAAWPRELSHAEVMEAMAYPGSERWMVGAANGVADEFSSAGESGEPMTIDETKDMSVAWRDWHACLTASAPSTEVRFTVPDSESKLAQVLRIYAAADSSLSTVEISVDGSVVGTATIGPGGRQNITIPKRRLTAGEHLLKLTSLSASGTFKIDALRFGGSWTVGYENDGNPGEFESESKSISTSYLQSHRWKSFRGVIRKDFPIDIYGYVPDDMAGKYDCSAILRLRVAASDQTTAPQATIQFYLNGELIGEYVEENWSQWEVVKFPIPKEKIRAGENVLRFRRKAGESIGWTVVDYYRLELKSDIGMMFLIR